MALILAAPEMICLLQGWLMHMFQRSRPSTILGHFLQNEQGGAGVLVSLTALPILMVASLSIEVTRWMAVKLALQRTADVSAVAGAQEYQTSSSARSAAAAAANLAELNGATGGTTRTWDDNNRLLSDNKILAQVVPGVQDSSGTAVKVTVAQTVPFYLTRLMTPSLSITITAVAWAEAKSSSQPCVLATNANGDGIQAQGNVSVTLTGCSMRSNASIATGGNARLSASAFYAGSSISGNETGGKLYPNAGTSADPYASHTPLLSVLKALSPGYGPSFSNKPKDSNSLLPGIWSGWDIKGDVTLAPGIYYVNGDISVEAQGSLSGIGVAIISSGSITLKGGASVTLSAALDGSSLLNALPGIVFASTSKSASSFNGNASASLAGVVYYPNGELDFGGTAQGGSSGCLEIIASSITLSGNPNLASNCKKYGALTFRSENVPPVALVQ